MAFVVADRVQEISVSPGGTGTINLDGGVVPNFKSFANGIGTGNSTYYCILDTSTGAWETGTGTYTTGTPNTLSRTTVYANSLNTTAFISFTNGNSLNVFCTYPASRGVVLNSANYIQLDFSNATVTNRTSFQTSTTNGSTGIYALPNGTSTAASWQATNAADPTNASKILIATNGATDVQLVSGINGTGTYLPMTFYTSGSEKMRIDTSGNIGIGTSSPAGILDVKGNTNGAVVQYLHNDSTAVNSSSVYQMSAGSRYVNQTVSYTGQFIQFVGSSVPNLFLDFDTQIFRNTAGTERMRLDTSGNFYVETGTFWVPAPAPTSIAAVTTLTAAQLQTGIINTTGTTYTVTLPLATAIDSAFTQVPAVNIGFDFYIVNTASGTITMAVNTGITSVGTLTVLTGISAQFRLRRTAANTYILYRVN